MMKEDRLLGGFVEATLWLFPSQSTTCSSLILSPWLFSPTFPSSQPVFRPPLEAIQTLILLLFFRKISLKTVVAVPSHREPFNSIELAAAFRSTVVVELSFVWFVVDEVAAGIGDLLYCAHYKLLVFGNSCGGMEEDLQG